MEPDTPAESQPVSGVLPEETEQPSGQEDKLDIISLMQRVDWEHVQPRTLEDPDWRTNIICLAELPEQEIAMYGYNDEDHQKRYGVAIDLKGDMYYFDWPYFTPHRVLPRIYWDEAKQQLQVALHIYTGTGLSGEELHVLQKTESELIDYCFDRLEQSLLLEERLDFSYEEETRMLTLFGQQENKPLFSCMVEDEVENISFGEISRFQLGDELTLTATPGYQLKGMPFFLLDYTGMPDISMPVYLENVDGEMVFRLGALDVGEIEEAS